MAKKRKPQPKPARPAQEDARVRRSKEAVLATTRELLSDIGLSGVSVDEVSAKSGVAKTTIYRHWPSRSALLLAACATMGAQLSVPDEGSFKADLMLLVREMAEAVRSKNFSSVLPSVIDAGERDPEIAALQARLHAGHIAPLYAVVERAQRRGELPRTAVPSEVVVQIVGPLFYRRWFSREPLDARFVKGVIERVTR